MELSTEVQQFLANVTENYEDNTVDCTVVGTVDVGKTHTFM